VGRTGVTAYHAAAGQFHCGVATIICEDHDDIAGGGAVPSRWADSRGVDRILLSACCCPRRGFAAGQSSSGARSRSAREVRGVGPPPSP
jgi:hypothetical protein